VRAAIYCAIALFLLLGLGAAYLMIAPEESRPELLQNLSVGRRELVLAALVLAMIANNGIRLWSRLQGERPTYYVLLAVSWGVVAFLLLLPDSVLSEKARAGAAPIGRTVQVMLGLAAVALGTYFLARWWVLPAGGISRGVQVNPLAERLPDPDNPAPKWEPNPDLDFTKKPGEPGA
jgi:hypothetical protein